VLALAALAALASCPREDGRMAEARSPDLERAAVMRGLVIDSSDESVVGLYARDTDRVCIVRRGSAYRVGAYVDYGDGVGCNGAGELTSSGERLSVTLGQGCSFDAHYDGDRIVFPASLPDACAKLCTRRASFAALGAVRLSGAPAEAAAMRDAGGRLPCSSD
jgi:hypothetical protein